LCHIANVIRAYRYDQIIKIRNFLFSMPLPPGQCLVLLLVLATSNVVADLPAVPVPEENPVTEAKRVLGKVLFWDEQLSSNDTVACGTCHMPAHGGADPRVGVNPGQLPGTIDNVVGSPGIVSLDENGQPVEHPVFGFEPQVTSRTSPSNFAAIWAGEVFWDGRAGTTFADPLTGDVAVASGGALENQVLETLMNDAEMAKAGRSWADVSEKIRQARPLALATNLPTDIRTALDRKPTYVELFEDAFGNADITPVRIAFAIATYQRTLVSDQTPWDRFQAGDEGAMSEYEKSGWREFQASHCDACHVPPLFTNNDFLNTGLRRAEYDLGRQVVTAVAEDAGDFKVPSLRNVGLRPRFMHTGEFKSIFAAVGFYIDSVPFEERDDIPGFGAYSFNFTSFAERDIRAFIGTALTDPRVQMEQFPFDRPTLRSERSGD
jgi:cytochrome c peroxidase